eukprot:522950-Hanusia_phi.AAC.1
MRYVRHHLEVQQVRSCYAVQPALSVSPVLSRLSVPCRLSVLPADPREVLAVLSFLALAAFQVRAFEGDELGQGDVSVAVEVVGQEQVFDVFRGQVPVAPQPFFQLVDAQVAVLVGVHPAKLAQQLPLIHADAVLVHGEEGDVGGDVDMVG